MLKELSPDLIRRRLTSLFPGESIEDIACERDAVQRRRRVDVTAPVWTLILESAVGDESRTVAGFQRVYATAANQTLSRSSFYDRFTPALGQLLSDLLEHTLEEVAVPHTLAPRLQQFRGVMTTDTTVSRLHRLLGEFPATHPDQSGTRLRLVHNLTKQTVERFELTDGRSHESSQFRTRNWLRGRLLLFGLGFYNYRRFALIEENGDFFLGWLKTDTNPRIAEARRKWRGHVISLPDRRLQDVLGGLTREIIDTTTEVSFKRRPCGEKHSSATVEFRVIGVRNEDTDDYHLYITNLPGEFTSEQIATLYDVWWEVEVLFRGLESVCGLERFRTSNPAIVELLVVAALPTLTVSRALLDVFQRIYPKTIFPREHWAKTFRFFAQLILEGLAQSFEHPPPDLVELMLCNIHQPERSRLLLSKRVAEVFGMEVRA